MALWDFCGYLNSVAGTTACPNPEQPGYSPLARTDGSSRKPTVLLARCHGWDCCSEHHSGPHYAIQEKIQAARYGEEQKKVPQLFIHFPCLLPYVCSNPHRNSTMTCACKQDRMMMVLRLLRGLVLKALLSGVP